MLTVMTTMTTKILHSDVAGQMETVVLAPMLVMTVIMMTTDITYAVALGITRCDSGGGDGNSDLHST